MGDPPSSLSDLHNGELNFLWVPKEGYVASGRLPADSCDGCDWIVAVRADTQPRARPALTRRPVQASSSDPDIPRAQREDVRIPSVSIVVVTRQRAGLQRNNSEFVAATRILVRGSCRRDTM